MAKDEIILDGRTLEGGGQLLRVALALSALTRRSLRIDNIRGNRKGGGGLKAQHLACVKWLAEACGAEVEGAEKGSKTLVFRPEVSRQYADILANVYKSTTEADTDGMLYAGIVDVNSAGSTSLVLQAILPFILFAPPPLPKKQDDTTTTPFLRLHIKGGTNVFNSPSYDYLAQVLFPTLEAIGLEKLTPTLHARGWADTHRPDPGNFTLDVPLGSLRHLSGFKLCPTDTSASPAPPSSIRATIIGPKESHAPFKSAVAEAIAADFAGAMANDDSAEPIIVCEDSNHPRRIYVLITATIRGIKPSVSDGPTTPEQYILGRDYLHSGKKIKDFSAAITEVTQGVVKDLYQEWASGTYVDEYMRDQLVIFTALARGQSEIWNGRQCSDQSEAKEPDVSQDDKTVRTPSLHARTAEWVAEQILGVHFTAGRCEGAGFTELGRNSKPYATQEWSTSLPIRTM